MFCIQEIPPPTATTATATTTATAAAAPAPAAAATTTIIVIITVVMCYYSLSCSICSNIIIIIVYSDKLAFEQEPPSLQPSDFINLGFPLRCTRPSLSDELLFAAQQHAALVHYAKGMVWVCLCSRYRRLPLCLTEKSTGPQRDLRRPASRKRANK